MSNVSEGTRLDDFSLALWAKLVGALVFAGGIVTVFWAIAAGPVALLIGALLIICGILFTIAGQEPQLKQSGVQDRRADEERRESETSRSQHGLHGGLRGLGLLLIGVSLFSLPGCSDDPIAPADLEMGLVDGVVSSSTDTIVIEEVVCTFYSDVYLSSYDVMFRSGEFDVVALSVRADTTPDSIGEYPCSVVFTTQLVDAMEVGGTIMNGEFRRFPFMPDTTAPVIGTGHLALNDLGPDNIRGHLIVQLTDGRGVDVEFWAPVNPED